MWRSTRSWPSAAVKAGEKQPWQVVPYGVWPFDLPTPDISVKIGASTYAVTQLFFADSLNQDVFASHPEYTQFGQPNTSNAADGIFGAANTVDTARMSDGAMLAWKVIGIRSSLNQSLCNL